MKISVPISVGELIDKITILEIKGEKIKDEEKLENINHELEELSSIMKDDEYKSQLKSINEKIWDIEDRVRDCERKGDFGKEFIETARSVYKFNDERARIKYEINKKFNSSIVEEKSYSKYE